MELSMVQFNTLFKQKMQEAKIIEKTHPRNAEKVWFSLTLFMIQFAKSPNCPRKLRKQLIFQADTIVKKIKLIRVGIIKSVVDTKVSAEELDRLLASATQNRDQTPPSSKLESLSSQSSDFTSEEEDGLATQLQAFPDVPDELLNENDKVADNKADAPSGENLEHITPDQNPPSDIVSEDIATPPSGAGETESGEISNPFFLKSDKPPSHKESLRSDDDFRKLSSLEEELKKMPEIMKEISPAPFTNESIITPGRMGENSPDLKQFQHESTTLDITDEELVTAQEPEISTKPPSTGIHNLNIKEFVSDPLKGGTGRLEAQGNNLDPFGPNSLRDTSEDPHSSEDAFCFACGGALKPGNTTCPHCGTENS